jgi:hypothetical protein
MRHVTFPGVREVERIGQMLKNRTHLNQARRADGPGRNCGAAQRSYVAA